MKICAISDTHGQHRALDGLMPPAEVLVHSGDLTINGKLSQWQDAAAWLDAQTERYAHVVCIAGNHDWVAEVFMTEGREKEMREKMFPRVHYLRDSGVTIEGVHFFGSPWSPRFFDWAFNADRGLTIKRYWDLIPSYTNVLVTHGPPMGILDRVGYEHVGCADLRQRVEGLSLDAHIFGHIHCGSGLQDRQGTTYVNASVLDDSYAPAHAPTVIEI